MLGHPKYRRDDIVKFECNEKTLVGRVYIVDAWGTFFQTEEPSYDIMVVDENGKDRCLYKHVQESLVSDM